MSYNFIMKFLEIDKQMLKNIFANYTSCKWMEVGIDGKIIKSIDIFIKYVCLDEDGNASICFRRSNPYDGMERANVNEVKWSSDDHISGVFTSEEKAAIVAKEHFKEIKKSRIAELEAELASLKSSL